MKIITFNILKPLALTTLFAAGLNTASAEVVTLSANESVETYNQQMVQQLEQQAKRQRQM